MKNISNSQIQERIMKNKNQLDNYLLDFHPSKIEENKNKFKEDDFNCGYSVFSLKLTKIIGMPQIGKKTLNYWIQRGWNEKEAENRRIKIKRDPTKSPMNIDFWMKKGLTKDQAEFEIKSQRKLNKEYWMKKGYSEEESILKVKEFQNENSQKLIKKYNESDEFRNEMRTKQSNCKEYWIKKGYSEEESIKKVSERQTTFSLEICIEKNGVEKGTKIWKERQEKWNKSLMENGNLKTGFSKISLELFDEITKNFNDYEKQFIKYYNLNNEYFIKNEIGYNLYDFTFILNKKIIEFNGDVFHGNPSIYDENDVVLNYKNNPLIAKKLWEKDKNKIELAKSNGFEILIIWESEYKENKKITIEKCLNFLKNNN